MAFHGLPWPSMSTEPSVAVRDLPPTFHRPSTAFCWPSVAFRGLPWPSIGLPWPSTDLPWPASMAFH